MAAAQYVDVPGYVAIIFRRTYKDLALPGAIMDRAMQWWKGLPGVHWDENNKMFTFPSGARICFGYMESEQDKYRYKSAEFQFIGFDEMTQFTLSQYTFMFSRLRRLKNSDVPLRVRGASNPGDLGHAWVNARFLPEDGGNPQKPFVPAKLEDNPHLDQEAYEESLKELDPITRLQMRHGMWKIRPEGKKFKRDWFEIVDSCPPKTRFVRFWDLAATEMSKKSPDPDYTCGVLIGEYKNTFYIAHVARGRWTPNKVDEILRSTAERDTKNVPIFIEQEPGSAGKHLIAHFRRDVLKGFTCRGVKTTGSKEVRANPLSSAAEAGLVKIVYGTWNAPFLDELCAFPTKGVHDDQVDGASGGYSVLNNASYIALFQFMEDMLDQLGLTIEEELDEEADEKADETPSGHQNKASA